MFWGLGDGGGGGIAGRVCWGRGGTATHTDILLDALNSNPSLDASDLLNSLITDDENISQFFQTHIDSSYTDTNLFIETFRNNSEPILLSLIIQSLNSKYDQLKILISRFTDANLPIDLIILQETLGLKFPALLTILGFQNIVF